MEQNTGFIIDDQLNELFALQPIVVTFKGKERPVHFFHYGTAERFSAALRGTSESESQRKRKKREIRLLSIVLSDLHGSSPYFLGLRRWLWKVKLSHGTYSDVEAVKLLEAAATRIQDEKHLMALMEITCLQVRLTIEAMNSNNMNLENIFNSRREA